MLPPKGRYPYLGMEPDTRKTTMTSDENPDELEKELFVEGDDDLLEDDEMDDEDEDDEDEDDEME